MALAFSLPPPKIKTHSIKKHAQANHDLFVFVFQCHYTSLNIKVKCNFVNMDVPDKGKQLGCQTST